MVLITIFISNMRRSMSKRTGFLLTLLIPILVVIFGAAANYIIRPSFPLGIIDTVPTSKTEQIILMLKQTERVDVFSADPATKKTDIITGRYFAIIEFNNSGFYIESVKDQKTLKIFSKMVEDCYREPKPLNISKISEPSLGIAERTCAFIVLFLMITAAINASYITKDRNNGTIQRVKYSPCSPFSYVFGNVLYNLAITYFQYFTAISVIDVLCLNTGISYGNYLLMGVWVALFTTAFGTCMASLFREEMQVNLFATCIALICSLIGGTFITLDKMPPALKQISVISPVRWFIESVIMMEQGRAWFFNITAILVLTGFIVLLFTIAISRNRHMIMI